MSGFQAPISYVRAIVLYVIHSIHDTRRKSRRSDLPVLLLWLLVGYVAYRADPSAAEPLKGFVEGVGKWLRPMVR